MLMICQEETKDHEAVYQLIKSAFASAKHTDGREQELVESLRKSAAFIPQLSLVAKINQQIVGFILLTQIRIGESVELALAPLAVLPAFQGQGIGGRLINAAHLIAKELGFHYSVVLGEPEYYQRFGYLPAKQMNISAPFSVPDEYYMAYALQDKLKMVQGMVQYDKSFGIC